MQQNTKLALMIVGVFMIGVSAFYVFNRGYSSYEEVVIDSADYKNIAYRIEGTLLQFKDGLSETETALGSVSKVTTRYFGNDYKTDLNSDGKEDVVFLVTQETGGSGVFYYVVSAINTSDGYVGSDGYLLGDRVAPQTIEMSPNPKHKNVIVVNYGDRPLDEPMSAAPSVGRSVYLKLDIENMMWGIVEPNFERESR
jgi:hypothetical protein